MKRTPMLYVVAFCFGALVWISISILSNRREAWDSAIYLSLGIPILCIAAAVFGFLEPTNSWRWGIIPVLGQAVWMFGTSQELGNLWPPGLVAFAILVIPLVIATRIGAGLSKRKISIQLLGRPNHSPSSSPQSATTLLPGQDQPRCANIVSERTGNKRPDRKDGN